MTNLETTKTLISEKKFSDIDFDKLKEKSEKFEIINPNSNWDLVNDENRFDYWKLKKIFNQSLKLAREKYKKSRN